MSNRINFFPKRFLSWGFKTLFASASSCQCKPPHFSSPAGLCRVNLDQPRSSGAHKILTEVLCPARARALARNSLAATRPRFDFIYTKNFQISRCDRKWRFSKRETAFAGYKKFSDLILSTQRIFRGAMRQRFF